MITITNYKSNLTESIYNKLVQIVGTTFTSNLGTLPIKYVSGYPTDITVYQNNLPLIILDNGVRQRSGSFEQGGRRRYDELFYIYVIAGGYNDEIMNEFMKNSLVDKILFGFDEREYPFTNYDTNAIEGIYHINSTEVYRIPPSLFSIYEAHKSQLALSVWTVLKTGN